MRLVLFATTLALSVALSGPARATVSLYSGPGASGEASDIRLAKKDEYKVHYKWERGGCKYEYKADRKGVKEKYKCK